MFDLRCVFAALLFYAVPVAAAENLTDEPAVYLQAFNETCRRGFPDLDTIARNALAHGWIEGSMRPVDGAADIFSAGRSRLLHRGGMLLFLTSPGNGPFGTICQITGGSGTRLSGRDVAAVMTPSLRAGDPTPGPGNPKADDYSVWTVAPGMTVQAGVSVYRGKVRSLSMAVRQARAADAASIPAAVPAAAPIPPSEPQAVLSLAGAAHSGLLGRVSTQYRKANLLGGYSDKQVEPGVWRVKARSNGPAGPGFARNMVAYRAADILRAQGFTHMQVIDQSGSAQSMRSGGQIGEVMTLWVSGAMTDAVPPMCRAKDSGLCFTVPIARTLDRIRPLLSFPTGGG
ncbi:hypothetical protein [Sphingomonas montana]|uniref:hypothetical protein n=1 Tax=Sphingomonas montana TaxID=1843236 RepID=UPI00096C9C4C|nr:hypothetical protein [Sphingomonas montana]